LSRHFFAKHWPQKELDALFALEKDEKRILPIWHDITAEDVRQFSPLLADRYAAPSSEGIESIALRIKRAIEGR